MNSWGIVNALVDLRAKNLGVWFLGASFALKFDSSLLGLLSVAKTSLVLLLLDLLKVKGRDSVSFLWVVVMLVVEMVLAADCFL